MMFFHDLEHLITCNHSSFISMYRWLKQKWIFMTYTKNNDVRNIWLESIRIKLSLTAINLKDIDTKLIARTMVEGFY